MTLDTFLKQLRENPDSISFDDTMTVINANYDFTPAAFTNGSLRNEAGQNSGSCRLFALAQLNGLSQAETLACFGAYYRDDVLKNPAGTDHQNIRNFMKTGWAGVKFESMPLKAK
ncbi:MAG TPA: HopJ type III effector protein [Noviherbaspirillum sp.]|uniref:HopJ type III effector protein n=1 Tax=Noviherbaspirillum sp. TaxID=1926288 RepID=UPI002B46179F|nr:HopJ type III effector protein [Noviherbaspirillum sp.]HJV86235.1 HopJ type III effector protein [Noviherbaspirillum sp.]